MSGTGEYIVRVGNKEIVYTTKRAKRVGRNPSTGEKFLSVPTELIKLNVCRKLMDRPLCIHIYSNIILDRNRYII